MNSYWELPARLFDEPDELPEWARAALEAAQRAAVRKRPKAPKSSKATTRKAIPKKAAPKKPGPKKALPKRAGKAAVTRTSAAKTSATKPRTARRGKALR